MPTAQQLPRYDTRGFAGQADVASHDAARAHYARLRTLSGYDIRRHLDRWAKTDPFLSMLTADARNAHLAAAVDAIVDGHDEQEDADRAS